MTEAMLHLLEDGCIEVDGRETDRGEVTLLFDCREQKTYLRLWADNGEAQQTVEVPRDKAKHAIDHPFTYLI